MNNISAQEIIDLQGIIANLERADQSTKEWGASVDRLVSTMKARVDELNRSLRSTREQMSGMSVTAPGSGQAINNGAQNAGNTFAQISAAKNVQGAIENAYNQSAASVKELTDRINRKTEALKAEEGNTLKSAQAQKALLAEIRQLNTALTIIDKEQRKARQSTDAVTNTYRALSQETSRLKRELKDLPNAFNTSTGAINRHNQTAQQMARQIQQNETLLRNMDKQLGNWGRNVGNYSEGWNKLTSVLSRVAGALAAIGAIKSLGESFIKDIIAMQRFDIALKNTSTTQGQYLENLQFLQKTADKYGLDLVALANGYKLLAGATEGTNFEGEQTNKIFLAGSQAAAKFNLTAEDTEGIMRALGQMFSKGCFGYNTPILMYDGSIKLIQDIDVDDLLMGSDNGPRRVLSLARGRDQMYVVTQSSGMPYVVNGSHKLALTDVYFNRITLTVSDFLKGGYAHFFGYGGSREFSKISIQKTKVDEYYGFEIDGNHLFRLADGTITHNTVQSEELKGQLGERLSGAFRIAAESIGKTTMELTKMLKEGTITADFLLPKMAAAMSKAFSGDAAKNIETITGQTNLLRNEWRLFMQDLAESGIAQILASGLGSIREFVREARLLFGNPIDDLKQTIVTAKAKDYRQANPALRAQMLKDTQGRVQYYTDVLAKTPNMTDEQFKLAKDNLQIQKELLKVYQEIDKIPAAKPIGEPKKKEPLTEGEINKRLNAARKLIDSEMKLELQKNQLVLDKKEQGEIEFQENRLRIIEKYVGRALRIETRPDEINELKTAVIDAQGELAKAYQKNLEAMRKTEVQGIEGAKDLIKEELDQRLKALEIGYKNGLLFENNYQAEKLEIIRRYVEKALNLENNLGKRNGLKNQLLDAEGDYYQYLSKQRNGQGEKMANTASAIEINSYRGKYNDTSMKGLRREERFLEETKLTEKFQKELTDIERKGVEERLKLVRAEMQERERLFQNVAQVTEVILGGIGQIQQRITDNRLSQLRDQYDYEISLVGDNEAAKKKIQANYEREDRRIKREAAQREKGLALLQATIAVALKLALGDWFGAAIAGAQLAIIAATPIPAFKTGKHKGDAYTGPGVFGEAGAEVMERKGQYFYADKPTLTHVDSQTRIYNPKETAELLRDNDGAFEASRILSGISHQNSASSQMQDRSTMQQQNAMVTAFKMSGMGNIAGMVVAGMQEVLTQMPTESRDENGYLVKEIRGLKKKILDNRKVV